MKKSIFLFITIVMILFFDKNSQGQTHVFYLDSANNGQYLSYCKCKYDSLKVIAPKGAIEVTWDTDSVFHIEDGNLVMAIDSMTVKTVVSCKYNDKKKKYIIVRVLTTPPKEIKLKDTMLILDGKPICLNLKNYDKNGLTKYMWSNGEKTQIVYLMEGEYTVIVSNSCGSFTRRFVIIDKTPARYK